MSTMTAGWARRKFMSGMRLCPPARIFARSPCSASAPSASSSDRGATYSKRAGFMASSLEGEARVGASSSGGQDDGLARGLGIEDLVGFLCLLELPAVGEELLHVDLQVGDGLRAFGLTLLRERPGADQRHLPAQEIGTDVQRHLTALADETGGAPRAHRAHRGRTGLRGRGGVERLLG